MRKLYILKLLGGVGRNGAASESYRKKQSDEKKYFKALAQ
jgi:hypothetical protein